MKHIFMFVLFALMQSAYAESANPLTALGSTGQEILDLSKPFLVTNGSVEDIAVMAEALEDKSCNERNVLDGEKDGEGAIIADLDQKKNKWKFSVRTSLGGPKDKLQKHFTPASPNRQANHNRLNALVNTDYGSYAERRAAIAQACEGLSDQDKIDMGSLLAGRLGGIYDFGRANGGSSEYISPERQWDGLRTGEAVGVCRDAALTVSHFLSSCGIPADRIDIEGYRTAGGGHQVVSVTDANGDRYTINWSELYQMDRSALVADSPQARLLNAGLYHTVYDSETGMVKSRQRTELALALKDLTGGEVDPAKLPMINAFEAENGTLAFALFNVETLRGDSAVGGAMSYKSKKQLNSGLLETSYGLGVAQNSITTPTSPADAMKLDQTIVYMQMNQKYSVDTPLYKSENGMTLGLRSFAGFGLEGFYAVNKVEGEQQSTFDIMIEPTIGTELYADINESTSLYGGGSAIFSVNPFANSSQDKRFGFSTQEYEVHGGLEYNQGRVTTAAESRFIIGSGYTNTSHGAAIKVEGEKFNHQISSAYSIYDRDFGLREDYVTTNVGSTYTIDKMGRGIGFNAGVMVPVNNDFGNTRLNMKVGIKF